MPALLRCSGHGEIPLDDRPDPLSLHQTAQFINPFGSIYFGTSYLKSTWKSTFDRRIGYKLAHDKAQSAVKSLPISIGKFIGTPSQSCDASILCLEPGSGVNS